MEYFAYRLNFFLWRFRGIVTFLTLIFFWRAVYGARQEVFGYQQGQMLTYVVGMSILQGIILSTRTGDLAAMIKNGDLVNKYLLRPWNVVLVWFFRDLSDKFLNLIFIILEVTLLIKFLNLPFYFPNQPNFFFIFVLACLAALILNFLISYLLSCLAFWVDNVWAPKWLFGVIFLEFLAGRFFPLDILPQPLYQLVRLTPFPYLIYFPLQIYLEKVSLQQSLRGLVVLIFWLFFFVKITQLVWKKGLKDYGAFGG